ncbi:hypothetical protein N7463_004515 [Penicillium fimorum]|uniref:Uncharacterized protein n=1 Tax=Penicillium fimorum TaxID=1882269 RepID=A0A9W9Y3B1_9EURO|nr:hypothetical protein N7463_004515 [Penicillium fimorum]
MAPNSLILWYALVSGMALFDAYSNIGKAQEQRPDFGTITVNPPTVQTLFPSFQNPYFDPLLLSLYLHIYSPMSDMSKSPYGLSVRRNGSCLSTEIDCGQTWKPFHACCPAGTKCPAGQDNVKCCEFDADCSELIDNTHCANSTANVYKANGWFCCADGESAFKQENGYVGCTDDPSTLDSHLSLLKIQYYGNTSTPTPSSTISSTTSSITTTTSTTQSSLSPAEATTSASVPENSSSSSNTGAIAGGVVGGVAGLAILAGLLWFVLRRRNRAKESIERPTDPAPLVSTAPGSSVPGSSVPGSSVPRSSVPESSVFGSSVLGSSVPGSNIVEYYNNGPEGPQELAGREEIKPPQELDGRDANTAHESPWQTTYR